MAGATNRGVNNTAFSPNADKVAQISSSGQPVPGTVAPAAAATLALDSILMYSSFVDVTIASGGTTITCGLVPNAGGLITVECDQATGGNSAATFSTGFRANGTVTPNSAKAIVVQFVSNGTALVEISRSGASV